MSLISIVILRHKGENLLPGKKCIYLLVFAGVFVLVILAFISILLLLFFLD